MIHDTLIRHFGSQPAPQLSAGFSTQLRRRLDAARRPRHRTAALSVVRRWAPRVYWIAAAALVVDTLRAAVFPPEHMMAMAGVWFLAVLALQRALHPAPLTRILRDAVLR